MSYTSKNKNVFLKVDGCLIMKNIPNGLTLISAVLSIFLSCIAIYKFFDFEKSTGRYTEKIAENNTFISEYTKKLQEFEVSQIDNKKEMTSLQEKQLILSNTLASLNVNQLDKMKDILNSITKTEEKIKNQQYTQNERGLNKSKSKVTTVNRELTAYRLYTDKPVNVFNYAYSISNNTDEDIIICKNTIIVYTSDINDFVKKNEENMFFPSSSPPNGIENSKKNSPWIKVMEKINTNKHHKECKSYVTEASEDTGGPYTGEIPVESTIAGNEKFTLNADENNWILVYNIIQDSRRTDRPLYLYYERKIGGLFLDQPISKSLTATPPGRP